MYNINYTPTAFATRLPGPHLWLLDFAQLDGIAADIYQTLLSDSERRRAQRYKRGQREFILCRAFVRLCLARYTGAAADALCFDKNAAGKPQLTAPYTHWQFNLSHTRSCAALAVIEGAIIGVDIEQSCRRNFLGIAAEYFHPDELALLQGLPEAELASDFFRLWTLKEAFFKALGGGIATGLHRARFQRTTAGGKTALRHRFAKDLNENEDEWQFFQTELPLTQLTYVALACRSPATQVSWFDGGDLFRELMRF